MADREKGRLLDAYRGASAEPKSMDPAKATMLATQFAEALQRHEDVQRHVLQSYERLASSARHYEEAMERAKDMMRSLAALYWQEFERLGHFEDFNGLAECLRWSLTVAAVDGESEVAIPVEAAAAIADILRGGMKRSRGGRRTSLAEHFHRKRHVFKVAGRKWELDAAGAGNTYREALAEVSRQTGVPEDTLDKWCFPRGSIATE